MATTRQTRSRCERAFACFLLAAKHATADNALRAPVDTPILVRPGLIAVDGKLPPEVLDKIPNPCVIVACEKARDHDMGDGYKVCDLAVWVVSKIDDANAPTVHAERLGFVESVFADADAVAAALSSPADPAAQDTRPVQGLKVFGFFAEDEDGQEIERCWSDRFTFSVHCCAADDADGAGAD